jgi:hypothetical protein
LYSLSLADLLFLYIGGDWVDQVLHGVFARRERVIQSSRRHWTMHVELGLTVTLSIKTDLVSTPTVLGLTAPMLLTAISKRRVKLKAPVILLAPLQFLYLTLVIKLPSIFFFTLHTKEKKKKKKLKITLLIFFLLINLQVLLVVFSLPAPGKQVLSCLLIIFHELN